MILRIAFIIKQGLTTIDFSNVYKGFYELSKVTTPRKGESGSIRLKNKKRANLSEYPLVKKLKNDNKQTGQR